MNENIINKNNKEYIHDYTLLGNNTLNFIEQNRIFCYIKQFHMKEGKLCEVMLGEFPGWERLRINSKSGLDIRKLDNSCIMEIKNKWNTCNSGSLKSVLDKLAEYKKKNPDTECILGIINPKKNEKKLKKIIIHNGQEIIKLQGSKLLDKVFVLNGYNYTEDVIKKVRNIMYN
jgi:AAA+ ATPase superfamily predicted ATPase